MPKRKYTKKITAAVLIAAAVITTIVAIHYLYPHQKLLDLKEIYPGQTYTAWDGKAAPPGYFLNEIKYDLYIKSKIVYSSSTLSTSWTCPLYVYGQEGKPNYKVDYAIVWTDSNASIKVP